MNNSNMKTYFGMVGVLFLMSIWTVSLIYVGYYFRDYALHQVEQIKQMPMLP